MARDAPQLKVQPLLFSLLAMLAAPAFAQQQPVNAQANAIRRSCRLDYKALCPGVPSGGAEALECIQQHAASVSPGCHRALVGKTEAGAHRGTPVPTSQTVPPPSQMRQRLAAFREACEDDYLQFCRAVQPGSGRAVACLAENEALLAPRCRQALNAVRQP
jgi:Cysteine rich repeat